MEIWLDTCDSQIISLANRLGIVHGVTTNPSILANANEDHDKVIEKLLEIQDGPLAVQVTGFDAEDMIRQALALQTISDRIIVKIPVVQEGLIAIKSLAQQDVPVMATAVFTPNQALLAAEAGALYVAPYLGKMLDEGIEAFSSLETMATIYKNYHFKTKILGAALRTTDQITTCAALGIPAVTLKAKLFSEFIANEPAALKSLEAFAEEWEACKHHLLSVLL